MKIYISGKITGLPYDEAAAFFNRAKSFLLAKGFEVVNPMELPHNHNKTWLNYMLEDLNALASCEAIYMLNNWTQSKGAKVEHDLAAGAGLIIIFEKYNKYAS